MRTNLSIAIEKLVNVSRRQPKQVIDDIITYTCCMIQQVPSPFHSFAFNPEFLSPTYNERSLPLLKEAVKTYLYEIANNEPFTDVIGVQYDEYLGKCLGQFFTPSDVASALVLLGHSDVIDAKVNAREHFNSMDPCCGAGALILPMLRYVYQTHGKEALRYVHLHLNDIDANVCLMAAMQCYLPAVFHRLPFGSLTVTNGDIIADYGKEKPVFVAIKNPFDYSIYRNRKTLESNDFKCNN